MQYEADVSDDGGHQKMTDQSSCNCVFCEAHRAASLPETCIIVAMACDFELPPRIKLDHAGTTSAENSSESRDQPVGANTGKKGSSPFFEH